MHLYYNGKDGLLYLLEGDSRELLTQMTTNNQGLNFISSLSSNKVSLPGAFKMPDLLDDNNGLGDPNYCGLYISLSVSATCKNDNDGTKARGFAQE